MFGSILLKSKSGSYMPGIIKSTAKENKICSQLEYIVGIFLCLGFFFYHLLFLHPPPPPLLSEQPDLGVPALAGDWTR